MTTAILWPTGAGDETELSCIGSANWAVVTTPVVLNDPPSTSATVFGTLFNSTWQRDLYVINEMPVITSGIEEITSITVTLVLFDSTNLYPRAKAAIKTGGTVYLGDEITLDETNTWEVHSKTWSTNPDTGASWKVNEVNALQAGVSIFSNAAPDIDTMYCKQVFVTVVYSAREKENRITLIIRNPAGQTLAYVKDPFNIGYDYRTNELGNLKFTVSAGSAARTHLVYPNEAWLYIDGDLKDIFKIVNTGKVR